MKKIIAMSLMASSLLIAGGYKIPETSTNSVALSGANIAHNKNADAAYDNPANMIFMEDSNQLEVDLMYVGLSSTNFKGTVGGTGPYDLDAEPQNFIIPSVHYVSPKLGKNNARVGLSIVVPAGLRREWKEEPARTSAEEFALQIIEVNPTVAFELNKDLALALGFRMVNSSGVVKSKGTANLTSSGLGVGVATRNMTGSSLDFGYNAALSYKATDDLEVAVTYRSKVALTMKGSADLSWTGTGASTYSGDASVVLPLPATLHTAVAYTFPTKTTVEFVYEIAYWSAYDTLDFDYDGTESAALSGIFGGKVTKNWKDTNTFRLGLTQELESMTLMGGVVYDESPTPESTLNFESPGSNSLSVSLGGRYQVNESIDVGLSALYSMKEDRDVTTPTNTNGINGTFSNSNALLISAGLGYKF